MRVLLGAGFLSPYVDAFADALGPDAVIEVVDWDDRDAFLRAVPDADVVVSYRWDQQAGVAARRLGLLHNPGAGMDKIDMGALGPEVVVANCYEHERAVAEYVLMVTLALSRKLVEADKRLRAGDWSTSPAHGHPFLPDLAGRRLGIVGFGRIGQEVARLGRMVGLRPRAVRRSAPDPTVTLQHGLDWLGTADDLDTLISESDVLVLAAPLDASTRGAIDRARLALLPRDAYLVNPARAQIVDEAALYEALVERRIGGAAIDVWWVYPTGAAPTWPSSYPFHELDNVILTPHYAGNTEATIQRRVRAIAANLARFRDGLPVECRVARPD